jgi:sialate O-acetylesterase
LRGFSQAIRVWGFADAGEAVTVTLGEQQRSATAGENGRWDVTFDAMPASRGLVLKASSKNTVELADVCVGEVWLCSGQSNMQFHVERVLDAQRHIEQANHPDIRIITLPGPIPREPADDVAKNAGWKAVTPETIRQFSAVGYFFALGLRANVEELRDVPIGLINASQGWTPAEAWMSREALASDPEMKRDILDRWDAWHAAYPPAKAEYDRRVAAGEKNVPQPYSTDFMHRPAAMFNGSIAPIRWLSIRGVIWYQGETNDARAEQYRRLFPLLIRDWRKQFNQEELPFLFAELAPVMRPVDQPGDSEWAELRESQRAALKLPKTAMAPTGDVGWTLDVHPPDKLSVGMRLAACAAGVVYGRSDILHSGPMYKSHEIVGNEIRITMENTGGRLRFNGGGPEGFQICGADKKWVWANARIEGDVVVVFHQKVPEPVAARYAWANYPLANLVNAAWLPAPCFRTDDWPEITKGSIRMFPDQLGIDDKTLLPKGK